MTQSKDLVQEPIARKWYIIEQTLISEKNSFSIRIAKYWNKLPENIVNAPSINSFKNRLDTHWKDEELYYANYKVDISGSRVTYREIEETQESGEEGP